MIPAMFSDHRPVPCDHRLSAIRTTASHRETFCQDCGTVTDYEPLPHTKDDDCIVDPEDDSCMVCHVWHGPACDCGGRGFHRDDCPEMADDDEPIQCRGCRATATDDDSLDWTTGHDGHADMWFYCPSCSWKRERRFWR